MVVKKVEFFNKGQKLKGVLYLRKKAPLILMCHGFTGSKDSKLMKFLARFLYSSGYSAFSFDFRGSGESEGEFTSVFEEASDLKQAYKIARQHSRKVILFGHSLGAGIISLSKIKSKAVVMLNPTFSAEFAAFSFLRRVVPFFWIHKLFRKLDIFADRTFEQIETVGRLAKRNFRFRISEEALDDARTLGVRMIKNIHSPILLMHGKKDKVMHMTGTKQAYFLAHKPKEIFFIEGGDHNLHNLRHKLTAAKKILGFLNENGLKGAA